MYTGSVQTISDRKYLEWKHTILVYKENSVSTNVRTDESCFYAIVIPMIINPEVSYRMFQKLSKL